MSDKEWLAGLQVGDAVMVETSGASVSRLDERAVAKITKTQVVLNDGERYNRETGRKVGARDSFVFHFIAPLDAGRLLEYKKEVARKRAVRVMETYTWGKLTLSQLRQVEALLAEFEAAKG